MENNEAYLRDIITFKDPKTNESVELSVYMDARNRYFAVDTSFLIDENILDIITPFGQSVELIDEDA